MRVFYFVAHGAKQAFLYRRSWTFPQTFGTLRHLNLFSPNLSAFIVPSLIFEGETGGRRRVEIRCFVFFL